MRQRDALQPLIAFSAGANITKERSPPEHSEGLIASVFLTVSPPLPRRLQPPRRAAEPRCTGLLTEPRPDSLQHRGEGRIPRRRCFSHSGTLLTALLRFPCFSLFLSHFQQIRIKIVSHNMAAVQVSAYRETLRDFLGIAGKRSHGSWILIPSCSHDLSSTYCFNIHEQGRNYTAKLSTGLVL